MYQQTNNVFLLVLLTTCFILFLLRRKKQLALDFGAKEWLEQQLQEYQDSSFFVFCFAVCAERI